MSRRWTPAELSELRRLAAQGDDIHRIARTLERTLMAIRIKAAHLRIPLAIPLRSRATADDRSSDAPRG